MEKCLLNVSLLFFPAKTSPKDTYSFDIINDSLIIKTSWRVGNKEYKDKLTDNQCLEIKKMTSALTQKYDLSDNFAKDSWGCILKVDNQVFYEDNWFSFVPHPRKMRSEQTPEEIKALIDYIVGLSPIPIVKAW